MTRDTILIPNYSMTTISITKIENLGKGCYWNELPVNQK